MGILNFTQINIIIILSTLIILLLRFIFRRNFSANFRMILWLLFLIRLLLPIGSIQQNTISSVSIRINSVKFDAVAVYENIIKTIYLIIAFAILLIIIFRHFKVINLLKISLPFENKFIDDWKNNIKDSFGISIRTCEFINSPLTYGFFNPVILLPDYD